MALERITTVLLAATSYDLTDLATAHDELQIPTGDTTNDAFLGRAITQVSKAIARYCNRVFPVETVQDVFYPDRDAYPFQVPGGLNALQLSRWPLRSAVITTATASDSPAGGSVLNINPAPTGLTAGMPFVLPANGTAGVVSSVAAGGANLVAPLAADVALGTGCAFGLSVSIVDPVGTTTVLTAGTDFLIDAERGWLVRLNAYTGYPTSWDPVQTIVAFQGGYAAIPDDLVDATLRVVTQRYQDRGRDPYLKSQEQPGMGTQTFWIGTRPGVNGVFTEEVAGMLDPYRVPTTA